ncbi:uncharacterized protein LOC134669831 [Cydia fagiglandana]|uniref:uncharacterized protein LOC134669831 n=1 Tax=Cydia fagiglandana TaxID=1458189 RepID=UPI002FEE20F2
MHVRLRLKAISDHIKECASFAEDSVCRMKTVRHVTEKLVIVLPSISKCRCEIAKSSSCYLLLIEQAKFLNRFFGVRILMHCLSTLTEIITFVNFIAKVISGSMVSLKTFDLEIVFVFQSAVVTSYVLLAPNILRIINCVSVLTIMVYYCEACCRESGDIIDAIDNFLVNKKTGDELISSLKTLRKLITSRPLKFSAAGFFYMESTLLLSLVSVVITYALILVQNTK